MQITISHPRWLSVALWLCAACGGAAQEDVTADGSPDVATGGDAAVTPDAGSALDAAVDGTSPPPGTGDAGVEAGFATASHLPLPQVPNQGGPRLTNVDLVTVTFPGFAHEKEIENFGSWIVTSSWYGAVGADYGVGPGTHQHVILTTPAPTSVSATDITTFLQGKIADGTLPGGSHSTPTNSLYMIFYPPGTTITDLSGGCSSNQDLLSSAWHDAVVDPTTSFAYAVIPTCSKEAISEIEVGASHELIEAATDAYPVEAPTDPPAYQNLPSSPWYQTAEVGDMCEFMEPYSDPSGFTVQLIYSNSAAAAGSWPCVPAPSEPYFNVSAGPQVTVARGQSVTIPVTGWSTAPTGAWPVYVAVAGYDSSFNPIQLAASLDQTVFNNGEVHNLTMTAAASATPASGSVLIFSMQGQAYTALWSVGVTIP
jgi:hypothetical protein